MCVCKGERANMGGKRAGGRKKAVRRNISRQKYFQIGGYYLAAKGRVRGIIFSISHKIGKLKLAKLLISRLLALRFS